MIKKLLVLLLYLPSILLAADFVEGKDYQIIAGQTKPADSSQVNEFFSYGCPWCYQLEAPLQKWLATQKKKITFQRTPVVFKPSWELYAKAYYTAKALGKTEKLNPIIFQAIQKNKKSLDSKEEMIQLFVQQGVDSSIANSAFKHSPSVDIKVKEGMRLMKKYQVNAVPAFVVNQYYKTDLQMAKSPERLFQILNFLLDKD